MARSDINDAIFPVVVTEECIPVQFFLKINTK